VLKYTLAVAGGKKRSYIIYCLIVMLVVARVISRQYLQIKHKKIPIEQMVSINTEAER
jgi:hypothetical protein